MWSRRIWLFLFSVGAAMIAPTFARADIVEGECYGTLTYYMYCSGEGGCKEYFPIDTCIDGTDGSFCNTGYGLCCGTPIEEDNASGECEDARRALKHGGRSAAKAVDAVALLRSPGNSVLDLLPRAIFVPDRCAHSYGVIDPGAFHKTSGGT
jgi:hypothetical protein